jgi:hypothetical protein
MVIYSNKNGVSSARALIRWLEEGLRSELRAKFAGEKYAQTLVRQQPERANDFHHSASCLLLMGLFMRGKLWNLWHGLGCSP